jgi:polysaccharide biosynthesis protein PelG
VAGIGFVLRRVVTEDTYFGAVRGYVASAIISSGPWLLSVVTLAILGLVSLLTLGAAERNLLFAAILYVFAFSLIAVGVVQLSVTRYVSDKLYLEQPDVVAPTFVGVVTVTFAVVFSPAAVLCLSLVDLPLLFRLAMLALFLASTGIWLAMIFLTAARDYWYIVVAFVSGYGLSLVLALLLGAVYGSTGYLTGFTAGQVVVFGLLASKVLTEFPLPTDWRLDAFGYLKRYPSLTVAGLSYNVAIWIDKLIFWYAPTGISLYSYLHVFPPYDIAMFLTSLAMVPGLTVFLLHVETEFYQYYRAFFGAISARHSLRQLTQARNGMVRALRHSFLLLLRVQAMVVLAGFLLADRLYLVLGLPPEDARFFQIGLIANSSQVLLLISLLLLLYFDLPRATALVSTLFLASNALLTLGTLILGPAWYGLGYMAASLIALALAQALLWTHLHQLEYHTFVSQPLSPGR